jgi:uncharacterized protein (TIGR02679 family)
MARAGPEAWAPVTISLPLASDEDRRAVAGLLGRPVRPGTGATRLNLGDLDATLRRTADGWDLRAVVETTGGPLPDRAGDARVRADAIDAAVAEARRVAPDAAWVDAWLGELGDGTTTRLHGRDELGLVRDAAHVLAVLSERADTVEDALPLPVLASRTTGDTKALGPTTLGTLVLRGLARRFDEPFPDDAAGRRALWEAAGVVQDDLASQVLVMGLGRTAPLDPRGPVGRWLTDASEHGLPFRLTLHQLTQHPLTVRTPGPVFVCENPAVLRTATAALGSGSAPLVCTEGRPSIACSRLLAMLVAGGCEVRYHGDFDWPGLHIAGAVLATTGGTPWRMGAADYLAAVRRSTAAPTRLRGAPAPSPWDPRLALAMTAADQVVYEEDVLDELLGDLTER